MPLRAQTLVRQTQLCQCLDAMGHRHLRKRPTFRRAAFTFWPCLVSTLLLLLAASTSAAASLESKERLARTACLAGDYTKGVAILAEPFVGTMNPTYVFNQGRCFQQNGRNAQAIDRFREYLRIGTKLREQEVALALTSTTQLVEAQAPLPPLHRR
jgi:hypothetical protein